mgnify:CR=1 FL=1
MEQNFQEKVINSFMKVRGDIKTLKKEIETLKNSLLLQNKDRLILKEEVKTQNELISKLKGQITDISTGNQRVVVDTCSLLLIGGDEQKKLVKPVTVEKFRHITDREFSVFIAVYQLEEEKGAVTYEDIAFKLGLGVNNTRTYVNELIIKGFPIYGERFLHKKIKFRIVKEFREQNLISEVLTLREAKNIKSNPKTNYE